MDAHAESSPGAAARPIDCIPSPLLVLGGVTSVQFGASLAKGLFDDLGSSGTVLLRIGFAALLLMALWRPSLRGHSRRDVLLVLGFGLTFAGMNAIFYAAIDRIPIGVGVTLEFVGPLGVAIAGSRRALDLLWVLLAAIGIVLLADFGAGGIDRTGAVLALVAGGFWAAYILLSARVGQVFEGGGALALAMVIATVVVLPFGIAEGGSNLLRPELLLIGAGVAVLSSAIPYSLELEALRRLPQHVFGVLMSIEPALGALAGFIVLGEVLGARELTAVGFVVVASAGAARVATAPPARD